MMYQAGMCIEITLRNNTNEQSLENGLNAII